MSGTAVPQVVGVDVSDVDLPSVAGLSRDEQGLVDAQVLQRALTGVDAAGLDDFGRLELMAGWERLIAWAQARQSAVVAEFVRRPEHEGRSAPPPPRPAGIVARQFPNEELAVRLRVSAREAGERIALAVDLCGRLPATAAAFATGGLTTAQARTTARELGVLSREDAQALDPELTAAAVRLAPARLGMFVRGLVLAVDPDAADRRRAKARADRHVRVVPGDDGVAAVVSQQPAEVAVAIREAVERAARAVRRQHPDDARTMDQLRADVFAAPFLRALTTGVLDGADPVRFADPDRVRPAVNVTLDALVLLGLSSEAGWLAGYGPIPADLARELAGDGTWRRLLTEPVSGTVLDVGTSTYTPPDALARHVRTRDQTCRWPDCGRPAVGCDGDHTVPFPAGPTAHHNLGALCRRHHRLKHAAGYRLRQPRPGRFEWTLPTGHRHTLDPPQVGPALGWRTDAADDDEPPDDEPPDDGPL